MRSRTIARFAGACLLALAAAPAAGAATDVGQLDPAATPATMCNAYNTKIQLNSPAYIAPTGVITSWSTKNGSNAGSFRLKVFRFTGVGGTYKVVGQDDAHSPPLNKTTSYPVRIPVKRGDQLGLSVLSGAAACVFSTNSSADKIEVDNGPSDPQPGATWQYTAGASNYRLNVLAHVEPDADGDDYGDETQDACPTDASTQGACPSSGGGGSGGGGGGGEAPPVVVLPQDPPQVNFPPKQVKKAKKKHKHKRRHRRHRRHKKH